MKLALQTINELEREGLIRNPAIGGAMALLFHAEPVATFDLDIFCMLPGQGALVSLERVYAALRDRGWHSEAEAVVIGGVPVQFIPAYNPLVEEALSRSEEKNFEGVPVRVLRLEYLIAIMVQTGRPKDRQRLAMLTGNASIDEALLSAILHRHNLITAWKTTNPDC